MATYDYKCASCDHVHEEQHGMMEDPKITCKECGGECAKHLSPASCTIQKYGDGTYQTLYEEIKYRSG